MATFRGCRASLCRAVEHRLGRTVGQRLGRTVGQRLGRTHEQPERGQISLLILGLTIIALMMVVGAVDVTAAQLARTRLLDAADGAALDASDAMDNGSAYNNGLQAAVPITDASVREAAADYLAVQPRPQGITSWELVDGTGSPDGQTSVIRLRGSVDIPIAASVLAAFGRSVNITVESRARSGLR